MLVEKYISGYGLWRLGKCQGYVNLSAKFVFFWSTSNTNHGVAVMTMSESESEFYKIDLQNLVRLLAKWSKLTWNKKKIWR